MRVIQLVLLAMLLGGTGLYFARMRSRLIDRLFVAAFAVVSGVMVAIPQISEWLAATLEVGRGVDVIIYFLLVFLCFVSILLYSKLRDQQAQLVELTRAMALTAAKRPERSQAGEPRIIPLPNVLREVS